MWRVQLRGTKCYVALGVARRGRLFLLGSEQRAPIFRSIDDLAIVVAQGVSERNCFVYSDFVGHDAGDNMPCFAPGVTGARD